MTVKVERKIQTSLDRFLEPSRELKMMSSFDHVKPLKHPANDHTSFLPYFDHKKDMIDIEFADPDEDPSGDDGTLIFSLGTTNLVRSILCLYS